MIEIRNLNYIYSLPTERQALSDINLTIPDGSLCAIIGRTGSGKSTFIEHLNRILTPTSGEILIDGVKLTKNELKNIRKKVGLVFQYPEHQLFAETVYEDIAFGPKNMGFDEDKIKACVNRAAQIMELDEKTLKKSPFELSGGQKRRAAIAGVLATEPEILILDEPTAGLDSRGKHAVFKMISELHSTNKNMIIIFVSHSMENAAQFANRIIVMDSGKIAMDGAPKEIFSQYDRLKALGLDVPQITRLTLRLKNAGVDIPSDICTVKEAAAVIAGLLGGNNV